MLYCLNEPVVRRVRIRFGQNKRNKGEADDRHRVLARGLF
jgi:hypothetical protein